MSMSRKKDENKDKATVVIDALMSAKGSEFVSLLADVIEFINTGIGFDDLMSKVERIRERRP